MKILVVDDEPLARERLVRILLRIRPEDLCLQASDGESALSLIEAHEPDLLLLDIRMPGMDGIEVAARVAGMAAPPAVIFCTAYDEYAMQALQIHAIAYLLKPVREAELEQALHAASRINRLQLASLRGDEAEGRNVVSSHSHRGFESLPIAEVRCFLAEQKYVTAVSPEGELLLQESLKELEEEFGERFVRVHRNALVATQYLRRLEKNGDNSWHAVLDGVDVTPAVSRRLLPQVKRTLGRR